jgi:hypothetical protein
VVTTLRTVSLSSVEHVKYWNGSSRHAVGKALLSAPAAQNPVSVAYGAAPAAPDGLSASA